LVSIVLQDSSCVPIKTTIHDANDRKHLNEAIVQGMPLSALEGWSHPAEHLDTVVRSLYCSLSTLLIKQLLLGQHGRAQEHQRADDRAL